MEEEEEEEENRPNLLCLSAPISSLSTPSRTGSVSVTWSPASGLTASQLLSFTITSSSFLGGTTTVSVGNAASNAGTATLLIPAYAGSGGPWQLVATFVGKTVVETSDPVAFTTSEFSLPAASMIVAVTSPSTWRAGNTQVVSLTSTGFSSADKLTVSLYTYDPALLDPDNNVGDLRVNLGGDATSVDVVVPWGLPGDRGASQLFYIRVVTTSGSPQLKFESAKTISISRMLVNAHSFFYRVILTPFCS